MAEEQLKKVEIDPPLATPPPPKNNVAEQKAVVRVPEQKPADESKIKPKEETKARAVVEKAPAPVEKKVSGGSRDRDVALADLEKEKRLSFIRAWEDSEKTKVENKAEKKLSSVSTWENSQKAALEAKLKKFEEAQDRKKAMYAEKMKNKIAMIHKEAEEKKAMVEAIRGEELLKAEELAAKYRATGNVPKKFLGCF